MAKKTKKAKVQHFNWICSPCGAKYGKLMASVCTWHKGKCDYCGKRKQSVTAMRNYGYPVKTD